MANEARCSNQILLQFAIPLDQLKKQRDIIQQEVEHLKNQFDAGQKNLIVLQNSHHAKQSEFQKIIGTEAPDRILEREAELQQLADQVREKLALQADIKDWIVAKEASFTLAQQLLTNAEDKFKNNNKRPEETHLEWYVRTKTKFNFTDFASSESGERNPISLDVAGASMERRSPSCVSTSGLNLTTVNYPSMAGHPKVLMKTNGSEATIAVQPSKTLNTLKTSESPRTSICPYYPQKLVDSSVAIEDREDSKKPEAADSVQNEACALEWKVYKVHIPSSVKSNMSALSRTGLQDVESLNADPVDPRLSKARQTIAVLANNVQSRSSIPGNSEQKESFKLFGVDVVQSAEQPQIKPAMLFESPTISVTAPESNGNSTPEKFGETPRDDPEKRSASPGKLEAQKTLDVPPVSLLKFKPPQLKKQAGQNTLDVRPVIPPKITFEMKKISNLKKIVNVFQEDLAEANEETIKPDSSCLRNLREEESKKSDTRKPSDFDQRFETDLKRLDNKGNRPHRSRIDETSKSSSIQQKRSRDTNNELQAHFSPDWQDDDSRRGEKATRAGDGAKDRSRTKHRDSTKTNEKRGDTTSCHELSTATMNQHPSPCSLPVDRKRRRDKSPLRRRRSPSSANINQPTLSINSPPTEEHVSSSNDKIKKRDRSPLRRQHSISSATNKQATSRSFPLENSAESSNEKTRKRELSSQKFPCHSALNPLLSADDEIRRREHSSCHGNRLSSFRNEKSNGSPSTSKPEINPRVLANKEEEFELRSLAKSTKLNSVHEKNQTHDKNDDESSVKTRASKSGGSSSSKLGGQFLSGNRSPFSGLEKRVNKMTDSEKTNRNSTGSSTSKCLSVTGSTARSNGGTEVVNDKPSKPLLSSNTAPRCEQKTNNVRCRTISSALAELRATMNGRPISPGGKPTSASSPKCSNPQKPTFTVNDAFKELQRASFAMDDWLNQKTTNNDFKLEDIKVAKFAGYSIPKKPKTSPPAQDSGSRDSKKRREGSKSPGIIRKRVKDN